MCFCLTGFYEVMVLNSCPPLPEPVDVAYYSTGPKADVNLGHLPPLHNLQLS